MFINISPSIYGSIINFYDKKYKKSLLILIDMGISNVIRNLSEFHKVLKIYLNNSEITHYSNLFDEYRIINTILKYIPLIFVYLDIIIMGYESFIFSNILGLDIETIKSGPSNLEKYNFRIISEFCSIGLVILLLYITYLSISDVIIDIFYCHEIKRVIVEESITNSRLMNNNNNINNNELNISLLMNENGLDENLENRFNLGSNEEIILQNVVNPLNILWLKYFFSDIILMKNMYFISLCDDDDNVLNLRNESFFSLNNAESFFKKRVIVPRLLPINLNNENKWSKYSIIIYYILLLNIYEFLDITLKLSLLYFIIQISYWPWNFLITISLQLIIMGMCLSFHNPPMTNFIIGFIINIVGVIPLLLSSQSRIRHNINISYSLLSLRSMEFLFSILILIIIPFNFNNKDIYWLDSYNINKDMNIEYNKSINKNYRNNNTTLIIDEIYIRQFFWFIVVSFFVHEITLFLIQKMTVIKIQNERSFSEDLVNNRQDNEYFEFNPYFRFI